MEHRISFLPYSEWDSDRGCVAFIALVDGRRARCLIDAESLFELTHQQEPSPISTFTQHREVVEGVARELIQAERLDGRELVIRRSDVSRNRTPDSPRCSPAIETSRPLSDQHVDGRQMSMPESDRATVWSAICERQRSACESLAPRVSPQVADQAFEELGRFEGEAVPVSAHELNLRRIEAGRMAASWQTHVTDDTAVSPDLDR